MPDENKLHQLKQALEHASAQLNQAKQLVDELGGEAITPAVKQQTDQIQAPSWQGDSQIIEGVFNGQNMVGADGKVYTIPANYASKSKLVEGDILKLTIRPDGSFIYKQIGPVERLRLVGSLVRDATTGDFSVVVSDRSYRVIMASVTYYKGQPGDEVVILVPEDGESVWAAVENVMRHEELLPVGDVAQLPDGSAAELPS